MADRLGTDPAYIAPNREEGGISSMAVSNAQGGKLYLYPYSARDENRKTWSFMSLSHRGGKKYKEGRDAEGNDIFQKHSKETQVEADQRKGRSSVLNYCRFFIDRFHGYVTRKNVSRVTSEKDEEWQTFLADATGRGESLDAFIQRWKKMALTKSPYWARLDTPSVEARSLADQKRLKIRPTASLLDPENVFDYDEDWRTGILTRIVVRDEARIKESAMAAERTEVRYTEWTKDTWERWIQEGDVEADVQGRVSVRPDKKGTHVWGRVPYERLDFSNPTDAKNQVFSESMIHDIADWQRDIFRIFSLLLEEWFNRTFSTMVIAGARPEEISSQMGSMLLAIVNPQAKVYPTGADSRQAESLLVGLKFLITNLFRSAQFEASGDPAETRTNQSGTKVARDLEGLYQVLAAFSGAAEIAENRLIELWKVMSKRESLDVARSDHPNDFDVQTIVEDVELIAEQELANFPKAFLAEQIRQVIGRQRPNLPEAVKRAVEAELEAFVTAVEPAEPTNAGA